LKIIQNFHLFFRLQQNGQVGNRPGLAGEYKALTAFFVGKSGTGVYVVVMDFPCKQFRFAVGAASSPASRKSGLSVSAVKLPAQSIQYRFFSASAHLLAIRFNANGVPLCHRQPQSFLKALYSSRQFLAFFRPPT
jgi:hypothetical protein